MAYKFDELMAQIKEEKKAYEVLLDLSRQKKEVLIGKDKTSLDAIVGAEEELLLFIGKLDQKRLAIAKEAAARENLDLEKMTLSTWPGLTEEHRQEIETFQKTFTDILTEIDLLNQVNSKLLKVQLDYVQDMMKQVTHISESTSYDASAGVKSRRTQENNIIDAIL